MNRGGQPENNAACAVRLLARERVIGRTRHCALSKPRDEQVDVEKISGDEQAGDSNTQPLWRDRLLKKAERLQRHKPN